MPEAAGSEAEGGDSLLPGTGSSEGAPAGDDKGGKPSGNGAPQIDKALAIPMEARPDGIPDKFWDSEGNQLRLGSMLTAYRDAEAAVTSRQKAPESYNFEVPKEFSEQVELDPESPLLGDLGQWGKKHNLTQEAVNELLSIYAKDLVGNRDASLEELQEKKQAELKALSEEFGDETEAFLKSITGFVNATFTDKEDAELVRSWASTARGVKILDRIRKMGSETKLPDHREAERADVVNEESLDEMMKDPRYDPRSPQFSQDYHNKVQKHFQRIYGE